MSFLAFTSADLWDAPYVQDEDECDYYVEFGWECDFHFGHGNVKDVIEEEALNDKYCAQVLRLLIEKADADIDELEKDLVFLQNELAWTENEEWPEICCNALREMIYCLSISIKGMRKNRESDTEVQFLAHRKPAKKLHKVVKALLRKHLQNKDEKPADEVSNDRSADDLKEPICHSNEKKESDILDSNVKIKKMEEYSSVLAGVISNSLSQTPKRFRRNPEFRGFKILNQYQRRKRCSRFYDSSKGSLRKSKSGNTKVEEPEPIDHSLTSTEKEGTKESPITQSNNKDATNSPLKEEEAKNCKRASVKEEDKINISKD